jgi:release factor glutamine methyltransferase
MSSTDPAAVYRPQADTALLTEVLATSEVTPGACVLDVGCGCGVLSVAAARAGAATVLAADVNRHAVAVARANALAHRAPVSVRHGDALDVAAGQKFDLVLANPPYVPSPDPAPGDDHAARAWDAGPDGRATLDRLCALAPRLLSPTGTLLIVHSELSGVDETVRALRAGGPAAEIVARRRIPLGPVLWERRNWLVDKGFLGPEQDHETLVVVRADAT